jgi:hypothetical protein
VLAGVQAAVEGLGVQLEVDGVAFQVGRLELALMGEDLVVVLPELALIVGALGGLGRDLRVAVAG